MLAVWPQYGDSLGGDARGRGGGRGEGMCCDGGHVDAVRDSGVRVSEFVDLLDTKQHCWVETYRE